MGTSKMLPMHNPLPSFFLLYTRQYNSAVDPHVAGHRNFDKFKFPGSSKVYLEHID